MARSRTDTLNVWPAFTDTMLAFVLVLVLMLVYQVALSVDVKEPEPPAPPEDTTTAEPTGPPPPVKIRQEDQKRIEQRVLAFQRQGRSVDITTDGTIQNLTLGSDVTFQTGSDRLSTEGRRLVRGLAEVIVGTDTFGATVRSLIEIQVSGHTDDKAISTRRFPSNWELSTARATRVVKSLIDSGLDPNRIKISATGYGAFDPVASNERATGRSQNRRIEMRLIYTDDPRRQN